MKVIDLINFLDKTYPNDFAAEWDNTGLLVGDKDKEVKKVYVALDATEKVIRDAVEKDADIIITHHPMPFVPIKTVTTDTLEGRRIIELIKADICLFAMHTNYDICGMADVNAADFGLCDTKVLTVEGETEGREYGFGRVGDLKETVKLRDFANTVKSVAGISSLRVYGDLDADIKKIAVSSGAGKFSLPDAIDKGADVLVTGDVDYHTGVDAPMLGIAIIDAGHYGTEFSFIREVSKLLSETFELEVFRAEIGQPYEIL